MFRLYAVTRGALGYSACGKKTPPSDRRSTIQFLRLCYLFALASIITASYAHAANDGVIYSFKPSAGDGSAPQSGLINVNGTFYGTTSGGGKYGQGTVYKITPAGAEAVVYSFKGGTDTAEPQAGLTAVNGVLYGTTYFGAVFSVTLDGKEKVLYQFRGQVQPGGLIYVDGKLFGTTYGGGGVGVCGSVFSLTLSGVEHTLHTFEPGQFVVDGCNPVGNLLYLDGIFYGVTYAGGGDNAYGEQYGIIFKITKGGKETVLYEFGNPGDLGLPEAGLINYRGTLYGTTSAFGPGSSGGVYGITPSGTYTVWGFDTVNGPVSSYAPLLEVGGKLYGTTGFGGSRSNHGTVFEVSETGIQKVLFAFNGKADGNYPFGGLIYLNGMLYGTTCCGGAYGAGTVFRVAP